MELKTLLYRTVLVFLICIYNPLQANKVFFNSTSQIQVTTSLIPLASGFSFKFTTCHGGALLYQSGPDNTSDFILFGVTPVKVEYTSTDSIFTPSTLVVEWRVNGQNGSVNLGRNLDKNIEYQVTFKPGASSENASVELAGPSVTLLTHLPKQIVSFKHSGPLIAGNAGVPNSEVTGFVGCMESGTNIVLHLNEQSATNVVTGCPLEAQSGCPKRTCPAGFTGYYCEVNIDDCASLPCHHYSTCIDLISNYSCQCGQQWSGRVCDNYLGPLCNGSLPCENGAICEHTEDKNNYTCKCNPGWTGRHCDRIVVPCDSSPCYNNGNCSAFGPDDFKCACITGFRGKRCQINIDDCAGLPCVNNGHCIDGVNNFTCNCSGTGYHGSRCEININECLDFPCQHNGTCQDFAGAYKCDCLPGYKDKNCETEINECKDLPCKNGATCRDQVNGYACDCAVGFNGTNCENNIDDCAINPCPSTATCRDGVNNYTCECKPGYTGVNCSTNINDCDPNPCQNGGNCTDGVNTFTCSCPARFNGTLCELDAVDDCIGNQCKHNATCIDGYLHYNCSCPPGYYGLRCENETNECLSSPCLNGGQCVDEVNNFTCRCVAGYRGWRCEENIDDCALLNPCKNNGTCRDGINSFTCHCTSDFHGPRCENKTDGCHPNPCKNDATCSFVGNDTSLYNCTCPKGFTDRNCSTNIDECAGSPCADNATCIDGIANYTCVCPKGYTGDFCQIDIDECASNPCSNNATCVEEIGRYRCECPVGFNGSVCENNINDCPSHGCYNNGTCIDGIGSYKCECQPGFNGTHCENNIDDCQLHNVKCQNGARCIDLINGFKCNCSQFTTGTYCELDIDECKTLSKPCNEPNGICRNKNLTGFECFCSAGWDAETNCHDSLNDCEHEGTPLCKNGATCIDLHRDYKCACAPGWTSDDCSVDIDECALGYCKNGATCYHSNNGFYNCSCAPGYMDHNCSTEINECDPNPCVNNANCTDLINDYNCTCPPGYTGFTTGQHTPGADCCCCKNCSIDINECESSPCLNNGTCNDLVAGYNCSCTANFTGVRCEYRKSLCIPVNPCLNNGTCVDKNHTYTCDCIPGFGGAQCENITTIGLNGSSYMSFPIAGGKNLFALAFEFRTTLDFGLLISDPGNTLIMRLVDGEVEIVYKGAIRLLAGAGVFLMDGLYHRVELNITNNFIHLVIDNSSCGANCSKQHVLQSGQTLDHVNSLYVGGTPTNEKRKNLIGCVQDVSVDRETVIPNQNNAILVQATVGCPRIEVCKPNPCVHGRCVDRWTDYVCECTRPWIGAICNTSLVSATFGAQAPLNNDGGRARRSIQNNSSYAKFQTQTTFNATSGFSFLLRTRQADALLALLTDQPSTKQIAVALRSGQVVFKINDGGSPRVSSFGNSLHDGRWHLINIRGSKAEVDGTVYPITTVSTPISLAVTYLGGLDDYSKFSESVVVTKTPLRGCLQDARLDNKFFQFYAQADVSLDSFSLISKSDNLGKGCPGEDACRTDPCGEGGNCKDLWNEYRCECKPRFGGKDCSLYGCAHINPCPLNATCVDVGVNKSKYECVLSATFNRSSSQSQFSLVDKSSVIQSSISMDFRTREDYTRLLYTSNGVQYVLMEVVEGHLNVRYNFGSSGNVSSGMTVNDGRWYQVQVTSNGTHTHLIVDGQSLVDSVNVLGGSWPDFVKNEPVIVGGSNNQAAPFKGCLRNVKVGGWLLPFVDYYNKSINISHMIPLEPRFKGATTEMKLGCHGDDVCFPHPCVRGSCVDIWNDFQCHCPLGFAGKTCNLTANMTCAHLPCKNNATCFNLTDVVMDTNRSRQLSDVGTDMFRCNCTPGYEGVQCERVTDECDPDPCRNGATCTDYHLNYTCTCVTGYTGRNCEINIDDCVTNNCTNGATCVDGLNGYNCSCLKGFNGTFCETDINECEFGVAHSPCWENGTITCNNTFGWFKCVCKTGYFGNLCQYDPSQACMSDPCVNGGTCTANSTGYHCTCPMGYSGRFCEVDIRECSDRPCLNNGTCIDSHSNSTVKVFPGYRCNCTQDYNGSQCENFIDPCDSTPCFFNRTCTRTSYNSYTCDCSGGYDGKDCEKKLHCYSSPCRNNGICKNQVMSCTSGPCITNYTCVCPTGFHGKDCELIIDYCKGVTCANGGTCVNKHREGRYECKCTPGYGNANCTGLTEYCEPAPVCEHNGVCIPLENTFRCECVEPYKGKKCDDRCFPDPCNGKGTCERTGDDYGYKCDCEEGYVGRDCNISDPCRNTEPCKNDAECFVDKTYGNYTCKCREGYSGSLCDMPNTSARKGEDVSAGLIVGIIVACLVALLLLLFLIVLMRKRSSNGTYSPSKQELDGARVEMNSMMKPPPEERLI